MLSSVSCFGCIIPAFISSSLLPQQSFPGSSVRALSFLGCLFLNVLSCLSCLSCPRCPVLAVLSCHGYTVLSGLSCPGCPVVAVLLWLSSPGWHGSRTLCHYICIMNTTRSTAHLHTSRSAVFFIKNIMKTNYMKNSLNAFRWNLKHTSSANLS
jgi:hypothetical protein